MRHYQLKKVRPQYITAHKLDKAMAEVSSLGKAKKDKTGSIGDYLVFESNRAPYFMSADEFETLYEVRNVNITDAGTFAYSWTPSTVSYGTSIGNITSSSSNMGTIL